MFILLLLYMHLLEQTRMMTFASTFSSCNNEKSRNAEGSKSICCECILEFMSSLWIITITANRNGGIGDQPPVSTRL